jgi:hypothetical protein
MKKSGKMLLIMRNHIAPLCLAALLLCNACPAETPDTKEEDPRDVGIPADLMGMVHAGTRSTDPAVIADEYDRLDDLNVVWTLTDFSWGSIQPESKKDAAPADWNWDEFDAYVTNGNARNKKILAILDYDVGWLHGTVVGTEEVTENSLGNKVQVDKYADGHLERIIQGEAEIARFCTYIKATISRYDGAHGYGKVDAWCIWNEPNLYPRFWTGTKEEFYAFAAAAATAIREVDPKAVIVGGVLNTLADEQWVRGFFTSGAMKEVNAFAYHPYTPNAGGTAATYRNLRNILSDYNFGDKLWITEVGYPTQGSYGTEVAEARMPQMVTKTITLLAVEGAQKIFWYHLSDPQHQNPKDSEDWFGLFATDADGSRKKKGGADAYTLCARYLPGKTWRRQGFPGAAFPDAVQSYYFEGNDGTRCLIIWNDSTVSSRDITLTIPGNNRRIHNLGDGVAETVGEITGYTLHPRNSPQENVLFFTWDVAD